MSAKRRIGIFGGTFDPPHLGHIDAARAFIEKSELDLLYVIPTYIPPHKKVKGCDDPKIRFEMSLAAFSPISPMLVVSDYEITKENVSYTVDTLEHFSAEDSELYFLCGSDMFLCLPTWRSPERIFELATIVAISRDPDDRSRLLARSAEYKDVYGARCDVLDTPPLVISSTEIREMVSQRSDTCEFLPCEVRDIIEREGLYR